MRNQSKVFIVKLVHTVIFMFMVVCLAYIAYCAIVGRYDWTLILALSAIAFEGLVLLVNRGRCPFTGLAEKYGAESGTVTDVFLPMWCARHTFSVSTVIVIAELIGLTIGYFLR